MSLQSIEPVPFVLGRLSLPSKSKFQTKSDILEQFVRCSKTVLMWLQVYVRRVFYSGSEGGLANHDQEPELSVL